MSKFVAGSYAPRYWRKLCEILYKWSIESYYNDL